MKRCFMLARTRSGSTVLRRLLDSHPDIRSVGEILNRDAEVNFFQFLERKLKVDPALCYPEHCVDLFKEFIDSFDGDASNEVVALDLKYECLHLVYRPWQPAAWAPPILDVVQEKGDFVMLLTRKNHLRRLLSVARTSASKVYSVAAEADPPSALHDIGPVRIPTRSMVTEFAAADEAYRKTRARFRHEPAFLEIDYDELFTATESHLAFSEAAVRTIATFLGVSNRFDHRPALRKVTSGRLVDLISNYDEVAATLRDTRWEALLGD